MVSSALDPVGVWAVVTTKSRDGSVSLGRDVESSSFKSATPTQHARSLMKAICTLVGMLDVGAVSRYVATLGMCPWTCACGMSCMRIRSFRGFSPILARVRLSVHDLCVGGPLEHVVRVLVWVAANDVLHKEVDLLFAKLDLEDRLKTTMLDAARFFAARVLLTSCSSVREASVAKESRECVLSFTVVHMSADVGSGGLGGLRVAGCRD